MKEELWFLVNNIKKLHPNDYANALYFRIIERLLLINEHETLRFIESVENEDDIEFIASYFPALSGHFQSKGFIESIKRISKKFIQAQCYNEILEEIEEAENVLDNEM